MPKYNSNVKAALSLSVFFCQFTAFLKFTTAA